MRKDFEININLRLQQKRLPGEPSNLLESLPHVNCLLIMLKASSKYTYLSTLIAKMVIAEAFTAVFSMKGIILPEIDNTELMDL